MHAPRSPRPPATVLVCTRGRGELAGRCLAAIAAALGPADELLVVEAETSDARGLVERLADPRCRWLAAPAPGKSRQLNHGIRTAGGELMMITDDDCVVPPGWVDAMSAAFAEPDVGIAFGPVRGLTQSSGGDPSPRLLPGPAPTHMWVFSHGAAMAVRRTAALATGGFDERLGPGAPVHGEEADLLLRMLAAGWRCWVADAPPVEHLEWRTPEQDRRNLLVYERGGGAWVGAALRRGPRTAAGPILARLRYQAQHFSSGTSSDLALRSTAAFASGLVAGLRLAPARFLEPKRDAKAPAPAGLRLPWPALRGRRCLAIVADGSTVAAQLRDRGAGEVVELAPAAIGRKPGGMFDVVVAERIADAGDPLATLAAVRRVCGEALLSIERIDPLLTIAGRGRARVRVQRSGRRVLNGTAHRELLAGAGFELQVASRPWLAGGVTLRALLARPAPLG